MAAGLAHNYSNCIIHLIHLAFFAGDCFIRVFSVTIYKPLKGQYVRGKPFKFFMISLPVKSFHVP